MTMTDTKRGKITEMAGKTAQTIRRLKQGGRIDPLLYDAENAIMVLLGMIQEMEGTNESKVHDICL